MLVDVSDDALAWMREYDVTGDGLDAITSFSTEHPFAIPIASQLVPFAQEWVGSQGSDRVNFTPLKRSKSPCLSKRPLQSMRQSQNIAEESHQCPGFRADGGDDRSDESASARTEILEQAKEDGAKAVPVPGGGGLPGVPSVSSGLPLFTGPPATAFSKYTSLVGPPPKVRAPIPAVSSTSSSFYTGRRCRSRRSRWDSSSFDTAEFGSFGTGFPTWQIRAIPWGTFQESLLIPLRSKECKKGRKCSRTSPWGPQPIISKSCNNFTRSSFPRCRCRRQSTSLGTSRF